MQAGQQRRRPRDRDWNQPDILLSAINLTSEPQSRVFEECWQQESGSFVDVGRRSKSRFPQLKNIIRNKITQLVVLHLIPALFHRIQFRRVCREIMKHKPIRMLPAKITLRSLVSRKSIPNNCHRFFVITTNKVKIMNKFMRVRRTRINRETEIRLSTFRRQCDETDSGLGRSLFTFVQNRNVATFRPGPGKDRNEREISLIP